MNRSLALCICFLLQMPSYGLDANLMYNKTEDGVIFCPKQEIFGNTQVMKVQLISDKIIGVHALPQQTLSTTSGLIYIYDVSFRLTWDIVPPGQRKTNSSFK